MEFAAGNADRGAGGSGGNLVEVLFNEGAEGAGGEAIGTAAKVIVVAFSERGPPHEPDREGARAGGRQSDLEGCAVKKEGLGSGKPTVITPCESKPGSMLMRFAKLLTVRPAPISSTKASAISTTTKTSWVR